MPKSTDIKHTAVNVVNWNKAGNGTKGGTVKRGNDLRVKGGK